MKFPILCKRHLEVRLTHHQETQWGFKCISSGCIAEPQCAHGHAGLIDVSVVGFYVAFMD